MQSLLLRTLVVASTVLLSVSCRTSKVLDQQSKAESDYCVPALQYAYDPAYLPRPDVDAFLRADTSLTKRYSRHDLLMANASGVLPLLKELIQLEKTPLTTANRLERVIKRQQIQQRLALASTELSSFAAELDCEGERADQLATYLDQKDTRRVRRLTIFSVVIGAVTTVATALIQADNTGKIVGISGGLVSAAAGGLAAFSSNKSVIFTHKRNLLADLWYQPAQSSVYPPLIWYVLTEKTFSNSGQTSISANIRQRWRGYVLEGTSSDEQTLYFGSGGNYQADDLHTRANMLNQLQSSVRSINQDLQGLLLSLGN
ncbi:hypothetical protein [Spirosoma agri]|uniref:hypothetical protein n=1 Tax=Spirosoma agri TaxID=1987381 RepID=UPI001FE986D0|nr:hypothetical protein [Spirosoma agri]